MDRPGQAVAVTFTAYIVGSVATDITKGPVIRFLLRLWDFALLPGHATRGTVVSSAVRENLAAWLRDWETDNPGAWRFLLKKRIAPLDDVTPDQIRALESERVADQLLGQVETLRTQLLRDAENLADELDQRRAEGEFRVAVGFPLLAIVSIAAVSSGIEWRTLLAIIPLVAATSIIGSGRRRTRSANDDLIELMTATGVIRWPKLEEAIRRDQQSKLAP